MRSRSRVTIARAFRAYTTEPHLLSGLVETDGLPDDLREILAERAGAARRHGPDRHP